MAERRVIVEKDRISYEGLFSMKEVLSIINEWMSDKVYNPLDKKHNESVKADGRRSFADNCV